MQIQGDLDENPTGQALADLIQRNKKILAKEVRWLQDKAWKAHRRAGERREHRNKTQNTLLKRISLLTAAHTETAPLQPKDRIKGATRRAMQGLPRFLHLRPTFQKLVRQHVRWKALLTVEIGKAESLMEKETLKQSRRDDRRDIGRKNEIFKHGIKGIKKITGKYNMSKPLTEVKISCPCGLKWTWQDHASPIPEQGKEARTLAWIKECTANFRTHSLKMTQEAMEIKLETLTDMLPLLQATQNPPLDLGTRSLIYDIGSWKGENLLAGIETFFQKNAYHPFATCGNSECGKAGPILMSTTAHNTHPEQPLPNRSIEHVCKGETCFTTDPTNFRSNRHHTKDRTFRDKPGIFEFRTIASGETIREPFTTFGEFSQFISRMPSHKAPGFSEVPADLFKQAPVSFQKRIQLLVNEILIGDHDCDTELLMAKVILIHKDKDIAIFDHYRPIALLNTIYQLIVIIITSRLRQLSENYAVMEGS